MKQPVFRISRLVILGVCLLAVRSISAQQGRVTATTINVLTNKDVGEMVRARMGDSTILKLIGANDTDFDMSVQELIKLKNEGVSQVLIDAMVSASTSNKPITSLSDVAHPPRPRTNSGLVAAPGVRPIDLPDEIGVYVRNKGALQEINPEIVNWQTGGVIKYIVTMHLDREHINGTVRKPHSKLDLTSSPSGTQDALEFYIRCVDGGSASEYQLLQLWGKGDRREFRSVTGGVFHASGGAKKNDTDFTFEKVASWTFKIELPRLSAGEYGFLAPGTTGNLNAASQGKIYTFRIVE